MEGGDLVIDRFPDDSATLPFSEDAEPISYSLPPQSPSSSSAVSIYYTDDLEDDADSPFLSMFTQGSSNSNMSLFPQVSVNPSDLTLSLFPQISENPALSRPIGFVIRH